MTPFKITYTDFPPTLAIDTAVEERVDKLEKYFNRITSCDVVASAPHHHQRHHSFHIRVTLHVPGRVLVAEADSALNHAPMDIYGAINEAFKAATRQLEDYIHRMREHHPRTPSGAAI
jgi:ribosomal subunit interface protein